MDRKPQKSLKGNVNHTNQHPLNVDVSVVNIALLWFSRFSIRRS